MLFKGWCSIEGKQCLGVVGSELLRDCAWKSISFLAQDPQNFNHLPRKTSSSINQKVVFFGGEVWKSDGWIMNPSCLALLGTIYGKKKGLYLYYLSIYIHMFMCAYLDYIKANPICWELSLIRLWFCCSLGSPTATVFLPKSTSCGFFTRGIYLKKREAFL